LIKLKIVVCPPQARNFPFYEYENIDKTQNGFCPPQARKIFSQLINARRRRKFFSNINVLEGVFASKINVF